MITITKIEVHPTDGKTAAGNQGKLRAYVNVEVDHSFMIRGMKIIDGKKGRFVAMPAQRNRQGNFRDVAHPTNEECRVFIEEKVLAAYSERMSDE